MNMPTEGVLRDVSLADKYEQQEGSVYLTGTQALVRLPMLQHLRDKHNGKNTGGYISGYRGSPLGGYDQALWKVEKLLKEHQVQFVPGLNEDLAATAIWGTQQVNLFPGSKVDGVFGIWYGKGPGVDRCGDVFRHANQAGTAPFGGVLALAGDDAGAKSSTMAAQTDYIFQAVNMPVFAPAGIQDYLDLGFHGFAASRFSGLWFGFKCVTDTIESATVVEVSPDRPSILLPQGVQMPATGVNIRWPEEPFLAMEERLMRFKLPAAQAYVRTNKLDYTVWPNDVATTLSGADTLMRTTSNRGARVGIVTTGKSFLDTMQALADLGIDADAAKRMGVAIYKVAMPYPLEPLGVREFCRGLSDVLVIEEKRGLIEGQLKEAIYSLASRPQVHGKRTGVDEQEQALLPEHGELSPAMLARVIAHQLGQALGARFTQDPVMPRVHERLAQLDAKLAPGQKFDTIARIPYFCSGCPHNTSTKVPEGSRALAGIGCHYMAQWMGRSTDTFTHMGGEGMTWVGQAPFVETEHVFQNIGDGTYWHSGSLAIRHAVATKTRMTYKILFNDAVAMTGGQRHDGQLTPQQIAQQMAAEGVQNIVVVTDEPEKYPAGYFAPSIPIHHRSKLDDVQKQLRDFEGVSVLIYDQTCASEKRRRRKRGAYPDPAKRAFINELVCEGCGDCGQQSNCVSIEPVETEFGRKRAINQSSCNKDFSCVSGFCPSFVTVEGGKVRRGKVAAEKAQSPTLEASQAIALPEPKRPTIEGSYALMVTGIGGTGVITIGQLLGMAAHLERKVVSVLDMAGLAQKGGSVISFVRFALSAESLHAPRIASASADAVIGCDLVTTASKETLEKFKTGKTRAVVNSARMPTGDFTHNPDWTFPQGGMENAVSHVTGQENAYFIDGSRIATALMGDSIASNLFMLGFAYQHGLVPVSAVAIEKAIALNETAVEQNLRAFVWGRRAAVDREAVALVAQKPASDMAITEAKRSSRQVSVSLDEMIERRAQHLEQYQNAAYANRYTGLVAQVRSKETALGLGSSLSEATARYLFKVMAIKDEYEVARLYTDGQFEARLKEQFEGDYTLKFHLAPPLLAKKNAKGELQKQEYGPWAFTAFKWLAKLRFVRGTVFDVFGKTDERKQERALLVQYETMLTQVVQGLNSSNHAAALAWAKLPEEVRGFGHVRERHLVAMQAKWAQNKAAFFQQKEAALEAVN
jgi:indolepyruvate ferredoxin oxidoreductase